MRRATRSMLAKAALFAVCLLYATAVMVLCAGCGASTPSASGVVTPAGTLRKGLWLAYYGGCDPRMPCATEVAPHSNLYWVEPWYGLAGAIEQLRQARAAGIAQAVVAVPAYSGMDSVRAWLDALKAAGELRDIYALTTIDEPDTERSGNLTDARVREVNAQLRAVMLEYPELADTKLSVIYACSTGRRPGITTFDLVGCDHYDRGCRVLTEYVDPMRAMLAPHQRVWLLAGGASPWRQDPACFEAYAHREQQVAGIIAFTWPTVTDEGSTFQGIRDNGMRTLYCEAGRKFIAPGEPIKGCT